MSAGFGTPWWVGDEALRWPPLPGSRRAEVLVVGGGFAGLSAAWTLREAGREVLLLEAGLVGRASARAAGILTASVEHDLRDHVRMHGEARALALWELGTAGVERAAALAAALPGGEAAFTRPGSLYLARPGDEAVLREESALRVGRGLDAELVERPTNPLAAQGCRVALRAPGDATCDPWGLCRGLAAALAARGVAIHERTPVLRVDPAARRAWTPAGEVQAGQVILAGQEVPRALGDRALGRGASGHWAPSVAFATFCLVTGVLPSERLEALGLSGGESFWDTGLPFFYGRLTPDRRLVVGGADLWLPLARGPLVRRAFVRLERELRRRIPALGDAPLAGRWGGVVRVAPDGLPRLGGADGLWRAGLAAGIGQALLVGHLAAERALGRSPPAAELLREERPAGWGQRLRQPWESLRLLGSLLRV